METNRIATQGASEISEQTSKFHDAQETGGDHIRLDKHSGQMLAMHEGINLDSRALSPAQKHRKKPLSRKISERKLKSLQKSVKKTGVWKRKT